MGQRAIILGNPEDQQSIRAYRFELERQGYAVLGNRPAISKSRKLALVARAALHKLI